MKMLLKKHGKLSIKPKEKLRNGESKKSNADNKKCGGVQRRIIQKNLHETLQ